LDYDEIDSWIKVEDEESFNMSRRLIRSEGLLCGGTSGAAVVAAVKLAKQLQLGPDKTMLVILPDSIRDYIAKVMII
jgi:cystathionine beta-synthase